MRAIRPRLAQWRAFTAARNIMTFGGGAANADSATPAPASGLRFPSNGESPSTGYFALQYLNPHTNGLPFAGPGGAGVTWIWRVKYRQQAGYYVAFWWNNEGNNFGTGYYGCHPYPQSPPSGNTHYWELAGMGPGTDFTTTLGGGPLAVAYDRWYTQAYRLTRNPDGTKTGRFYIDLPSLANAHIIQATSTAAFGETTPAPLVVIGDAPWAPAAERLGGTLGQLKIIAKVLSEADMLVEAADMSRLVTADALANVWYGKNGWASPDDLVCDYGTGRSFAWANALYKATVEAI